MHEIGHSFGLEHIEISEMAIMAPYYHPTVDSDGHYMPPKLTSLDVSAARKLYGPRIEVYHPKQSPETSKWLRDLPYMFKR